MKDIKAIIQELRKSNIRLSLKGENIEIEGELSTEMLNKIRQFKEEIKVYLKQNTGGADFNRITPVAVQADYELSSSQKRLWILGQFEEINAAYNIAKVYVIEGPLHVEILEEAFKKLIERHESLRTIFIQDENGEPRQVILDADHNMFRMVHKDLVNADVPDDKLKQYIQKECFRPFNLSEGPLVRINLCRESAAKWVLIYVMHHIISDAWSMGILLNELLYYYKALLEGKQPMLKPLQLQYKDYAAWQQLQLQQLTMDVHKKYWLSKLEGDLPVLEIVTDKLRPAVKSYNGGVLTRRINARLTNTIKRLSQEQGGTLFVGLLSVVYALLYRYSNQNDIIIGTPVAGREHIDLEQQIGFYINTLALRTRFSGENNFRELISKVKQTTFDAYEHQAYPFDALINELDLPRDLSRNALFDVMVMLQNTKLDKPADTDTSNEITVKLYEEGQQTISKFDLGFGFVENGDEIHLSIEYNSDIYNDFLINQLSNHFEQLLNSLTADPEIPIQAIDFLTEKEKILLLKEFNGQQSGTAISRTIIDLFAEQVDKTPDQISLVFNDKSYTYTDLNELSNQFCQYLKQQYQVKKGEFVAIELPRSEWVIIALFGVLKCGAAYLPVDPVYPREKIDFIITDSKCKAVIDENGITQFLSQSHQYDNKNINDSAIDEIAYVMYTSGSTGFPKGCLITNANLTAYISWANNYFFKDKPANFGWYTSISFDLTVTSIFCSLTQGGKLYIYPSDTELPEIFSHSFSHTSGINCIKLTPSHINMLQHLDLHTDAIGCAIVGGEEIMPGQIQLLKQINPSIKVYNEYGPTEGTVGCIAKEVDTREPILIGKPADHVNIYILNQASALCPIGVLGEICIGGEGVSAGYLFNQALTTAKFITDPFVTGKKIYRTGDLGRWTPEGEIAFLGRIDNQVKIRGHRIEIEEIELKITAIKGIDNVVVIAKANADGDKELIAYLVSDVPLEVASIKMELLKKLPSYMVPDYFVQLETMPLTVNGKIDKKKLPLVEGIEIANSEYAPPGNDTEEKMLQIWNNILSKTNIGVRDNFFELGGNSLKAMKLMTEIHKEFNIKIKLADLFKYATIEEISKDILRKIWAKQSKEVPIDDLTTEQNFIL